MMLVTHLQVFDVVVYHKLFDKLFNYEIRGTLTVL